MATTTVNSNENISNDSTLSAPTGAKTTIDPTESTTQFLQTGIEQKTEFSDKRQFDSMMYSEQVVTDLQSIQKFLARPIVLRQGTFTDATANIMHIIDLPFDLLFQTLYTPKVVGFLNFRATAHITIQMNASRFCAGRLLMYFIPQAQVDGVMALNRSIDLITKTSAPNVQLDLATETEATLSIPHVSPKLYYDLTTGNGPVGGVYISVYSALRIGTGATNPTYTVWGHFTDVELEVPVVPGDFLTGSSFALSEGLSIQRGDFKTQSGLLTSTKKKRAPSDAELAGNGSISMGLTNISTGLRTISKANIPILSSLLATPAWVTASLANVAGAFGYSNPTNEQMPQLARLAPTNYMSHNDRGNNIDKLSYFSSNKVEVIPKLGCTDLDEASIAYIASRPAYFASFTMSTSHAYDSTLWVLDISSTSFRSASTPITDGTSNWTYRTYTPVGMLMQYFQYWRGSLKFTFKIVKTEFHTGRLAVYFNPNPNGTQITPTLEESNYLLRTVVDLTNTTEFSLVVPYSNNSPWMQEGETMGRMAVRVLNPLQAPPTVMNTIEFLVEVSGGDDFEVNAPGPLSTTFKLQPIVALNGAFVTQSAPIGKSDTLGSAVITGSQQPTQAKFCHGERVASIYNVLKRFEAFTVFGDLTTNMTWIRPFEINAMGRGWQQSDFSVSSAINDSFSLFSSAYAYSRGSANFRYMSGTFGELSRMSLIYDDRANRPFVGSMPLFAPIWTYTNTTFSTSTDNGGVEISVPQYAELPMRLNRLNCATDTGPGAQNYCPPADEYGSVYAIEWRTQTTPSKNHYFARSAGEDFQLGFFLGFPPVFDMQP